MRHRHRANSIVLIVPGPLGTCSGGYEYDRRIVAGLRELGWSVAVRELDASFPRPTAAALAHAARVLAEVSDGAIVLIDGLALGAMPEQVEREQRRLRIAGLVHHPLAAETGIGARAAAELEASERRALAAVCRVIVTSAATAAVLSAYGVEPERIAVVEPGTDRGPIARGSQGGALSLLSVASIIPRKGHDTLFRALVAVAASGWHLTCVGSLDRDRRWVDRLRKQLRADGLDDRVTLAGEADPERVAAYYDRADVFVLPALYEGYGMAVAEAIARGLPVVSTPTGAIADLVGDCAGRLVPPGDAGALASALSEVIGDAQVRARLAGGSRQARERLPTWRDASEKMAAALAAAFRLQPSQANLRLPD